MPMPTPSLALCASSLVLALPACSGCDERPAHPADAPSAAPSSEALRPERRMVRPAVLASHPHDVSAFTQGLLFHEGELLESTGGYGKSTLRRVETRSGRALARVDLGPEIFGEGLALLGEELFQLTWQEHRCFVYDASTLARRREVPYDGEGWGLTSNGESLIMSDGTSVLRFREPGTFRVVRSLAVTDGGTPLERLNELEWVRGEIFANVWEADVVARIDPASGHVLGYLDLSTLPEPRRRATPDDVLNGIAFDPASGRLFVTGKEWSNVFELAWPP
jgi:glutamine cyclotransferase